MSQSSTRSSPPREAKAVDGRDERLRVAGKLDRRRFEDAAAPLPGRPRLVRGRRLFEVGAGTEGPPGAGQDANAHRRVGREIGERRGEVGLDGAVERIQPVGAPVARNGDGSAPPAGEFTVRLVYEAR